MKRILLSICFGVFILLSESCKKHGAEQIKFDYERAAGLWVPYEYKLSDGRVFKDLYLSKVFGAYSESAQLNKDRTFIPVAWINNNDFKLSTLEKGTYEYFPLNKTLKFDGTFHNEYVITKFQDAELWLKTTDGDVFKFKKQQ